MASLRHILRKLRTRESFTRNVASTFGVQVLTLALAVASSAITARWLGAEGRGVLQLCLLAPTVLGLFLGGGIGGANVHYLGARRFDVPTMTANAVTFAGLATALGGLLAGVLILTGAAERLLPGVPIPLLMVAMLGLPLALLAAYFGSILQGLQRIPTLNGINLLSGCLLLLLIVLLVVGLRLSVVGALAATLATSAFSLGQMVHRLRCEGARFAPRWNRAAMRTTLLFGLREHVGSIMQFFNYRLDAFLLNGMLGAADVGLYGVATRLAELVWYFPNAVSFAMMPKAASTEPREMNRFTPHVFLLTLGATAAAAVGLALIGKPLIRIVFSEEFSAAYAPMVALLPGVALLGAARVLAYDVTGRGYPAYNSIVAGVALVLTVVLNLVLIPRIGMTGAALASTGSYAVTFVGTLVVYRIVSRESGRTVSPSEAALPEDLPPAPGAC